MHNRRKFLRNCSLAAAAIAMAPASSLAEYPGLTFESARQPGFEQFGRHLNSWFMVRDGSRIYPLLLVGAAEFPAAVTGTADEGNEKFSLRFSGPGQVMLAQDTYAFEHPRLGRLSIFIVPGGSRDGRNYYNAVFDRPTSPAGLARQVALAPRRIEKT